MVCNNCRKEVDNDLVFCTECGSRLFEVTVENPTVLISDSVVTQPLVQKQKSSLKWGALIIGVIAVLVVSGLGLLLFFNPFTQKNKPQNPTPKTSPTATRKPTNQNKPTNILTNNSNIETNQNENDSNSNSSDNQNTSLNFLEKEEVILDENVNVDENSYIAFPFKVTKDQVKFVGEVKILDGEHFDGYVFLQEMYDEHSVDPTYKMFSFDSTSEIEQYLMKGDYVIVFANNDGQGVSLKARFSQTPQSFNPSK